MDREERRTHQVLACGLMLAGIVARFVPHPPNVTPVTAIALFGGTYLSKRWAIALSLFTIAISDLVLGLHDVIAFTWASVAMTGGLGWWIRTHPSARRIVTVSLLGATIFFVVTNFGVWLVGDGGRMYPKTLEGFWTCYLAALPFYRNSLIGDLAYTLAIFGLYAWATTQEGQKVPGTVPRITSA